MKLYLILLGIVLYLGTTVSAQEASPAAKECAEEAGISEKELKRVMEAIKDLLPKQPGDVETFKKNEPEIKARAIGIVGRDKVEKFDKCYMEKDD